MSIADQIRDQALRLPPQERATLARDLIDSLAAGESSDDVEAAWSDEIEARAEAWQAGEMAADDWQPSLARVREQLRARRKA